jgi:hypothetical protein
MIDAAVDEQRILFPCQSRNIGQGSTGPGGTGPVPTQKPYLQIRDTGKPSGFTGKPFGFTGKPTGFC